MDLRHRGVLQEAAGGTTRPFEGRQERRTGKTSERLGDGCMSLLRSNGVYTGSCGDDAARLFSLRGVRGDRRSDESPPGRREPEEGGPATGAATPRHRCGAAARQSRIHPVTQRARTVALGVTRTVPTPQPPPSAGSPAIARTSRSPSVPRPPSVLRGRRSQTASHFF